MNLSNTHCTVYQNGVKYTIRLKSRYRASSLFKRRARTKECQTCARLPKRVV